MKDDKSMEDNTTGSELGALLALLGEYLEIRVDKHRRKEDKRRRRAEERELHDSQYEGDAHCAIYYTDFIYEWM